MFQTPEDIPRQFEDAWNDKDANALAALFAEDADFVNVVGLWWQNRPDIERAHEYGLTTFFAQSQITARRVKVKLIRPDVAVILTRWRLIGQIDKVGQTIDPRFSVMTLVASRGAKGWIVQAAQNTDIVPGMETFAARDLRLDATDYRGTET